MEKQVTLIDVNGTEIKADVIMCFKVKGNDKEYMIYQTDATDNEMDTIQTSIISKGEDNKYYLENIEDENEWSMIKTVMKKVLDEEEA